MYKLWAIIIQVWHAAAVHAWSHLWSVVAKLTDRPHKHTHPWIKDGDRFDRPWWDVWCTFYMCCAHARGGNNRGDQLACNKCREIILRLHHAQSYPIASHKCTRTREDRISLAQINGVMCVRRQRRSQHTRATVVAVALHTHTCIIYIANDLLRECARTRARPQCL